MLKLCRTGDKAEPRQQDVAPDSGLVFGIVLGRYWLGFSLDFRLGVVILHTIFQRANALAQTLAQLGQFFGAEHQQCYREDHQQVHGLKQTFKHKASEPDMPTGMPDSTTTM